MDNTALALEGLTLVDPAIGTATAATTVVFEEGRVIHVGPSSHAPILDSAQRLDVTGLFAVPGLIDMHVHCCAYADALSLDATGGRFGSDIQMTVSALTNLWTAASAGVTTVRDLGGSASVMFELKRLWSIGRVPGARPLVAGPMITAIGGHGTEANERMGREVCGTAEITRAVRELVALGADVIKLVTSGAVAATELTPDELIAAVEEAHWAGVPVASHANFGRRGIKNSIDAGCDSIEHCCIVDDEILAAMTTHGAAYSPTLSVLTTIAERPDIYRSTSRLVRRVRETLPTHLTNVGLAHAAGVRVIAGTDAGMPGVGFDALLTELELLVACGLDPLDALRAATTVASEVLRRPDLGHASVGSCGDLLVIDRNPLEEISNLRHMRMVVQHGEIFRNDC